jgi:uncharacterized integral membrane protein
MLLSLILFVIMAVLAAYIASNNVTVIDMNLLGYALKGPTGVVVVSAFGIGVLLGIVAMLPALISRSWAVIRHRRKLQDLQDLQNRQSSRPPEPKDEEAEQH